MHSMLAQALNQQEMVNWKAVPTLKIKRENFFFCQVQFPSINRTWRPAKALNYRMAEYH